MRESPANADVKVTTMNLPVCFHVSLRFSRGTTNTMMPVPGSDSLDSLLPRCSA